MADLAETRGISYEEADKLEESDHLEAVQTEMGSRTLTRSGERIVPKATHYITVSQVISNGSSGSFSYRVRAMANARAERYHSSSYGDYQKWSSIGSYNVLPDGSGESTWETGVQDAYIVDIDGYANKIEFLGAGNAVYTVNYSASVGASALGFEVSTEVGGTYYCRKYVEFDIEFGSNNYLDEN